TAPSEGCLSVPAELRDHVQMVWAARRDPSLKQALNLRGERRAQKIPVDLGLDKVLPMALRAFNRDLRALFHLWPLFGVDAIKSNCLLSIS
ncbi:MAG TPA: hypothetical protein VGW33_05385, partial [Terriglobia bacterium]|nr:hypothetical protein [Terriglobia bacterium]